MSDTRDKSDEYLWQGTGEPDAEVERLERALGTYRRPLPTLPPLPPRVAVRRSVASVLLPLATAAAVVALVALAGWYASGAGRAG
ncbi:MAG: hypothetical protein ACRD1S_00335, partial [Vicinamibacterales bacterium]